MQIHTFNKPYSFTKSKVCWASKTNKTKFYDFDGDKFISFGVNHGHFVQLQKSHDAKVFARLAIGPRRAKWRFFIKGIYKQTIFEPMQRNSLICDVANKINAIEDLLVDNDVTDLLA